MEATSTTGVGNPEYNDKRTAYLSLLSWLSAWVRDAEDLDPAGPVEHRDRPDDPTSDRTSDRTGE